MNKLLLGDCLTQMQTVAKESVDLIYLDPPFFTEKEHKLSSRARDKEFRFNDIWRQQAHYAEFLYHRLQLMRNLMSTSASIFVHCDKAANHVVRGLMDEVFGSSNFQSEIIWHYKRWSNAKKGLLPAHQNIYFYSKTKDFKFNKHFEAYSATTNLDQILQKRTRDTHNKSVYARDEKGDVKVADAKKGVPLSDVWDIPYLNPKAKERVGYPTQKPLALLEKIIALTTDEGDLVLDPFTGSGTTCVAAKRLGRRFIGIDESQDAIELAEQRLLKPLKSESRVLSEGRESYKKADAALLQCLKGIDFNVVHRNQGLDAILSQNYKGAPVFVKVQKIEESLETSLKLLTKAANTKGCKKAFLIQTRYDLSVDTEAIELSNGIANQHNAITHFADTNTANDAKCKISILKTVQAQIEEDLI
ncbi:site-specific DNA-methyltransferase [Glaciecola sp. MH2013]|uniref:DNA-methyltransferase n=1 Tax=Glaciecola sp. MH2013 TaxID=2785524 RepID=UPI00189CF675|nr:DNA methyltransferase [Glaciecola sp. MH2013]MBF7073459.1 site-specific DNA-methyltransferase [Glaciecola sp. MH2013]